MNSQGPNMMVVYFSGTAQSDANGAALLRLVTVPSRACGFQGVLTVEQHIGELHAMNDFKVQAWKWIILILPLFH